MCHSIVNPNTGSHSSGAYDSIFIKFSALSCTEIIGRPGKGKSGWIALDSAQYKWNRLT
ncbi:hypothetical protein PISMIDRAFT_690648 [Pisolithus microcarpus 441]|uniref:Uncharacterized protein n=1 Tax=Pisolithus microcarpus 441 TaxID=765257 RepID=A0A0C9Y1H1_9AGAM|nr:hypothetical protein PISMIDRAFT_690648 [Pisolithus microcarpus 441]